MAKEKSEDPERAVRKAEKKARKEAKRADSDGVTKAKKEKKSKSNAVDVDAENIQNTATLLNTLETEKPGTVVVNEVDDGAMEVVFKKQPLIGALVPFANPLADEKTAKKIFKNVKKANKVSCLKRGVKECVKELRKSTPPAPSSKSPSPIICIIAADISPMDVISHLPVLCEDKSIPYIFVSSRLDLGAAGQTKRPTSVVLLMRENLKKKKNKKKDGEGAKEGKEGTEEKKKKGGEDVEMKDAKEGKETAETWVESYDDLLKVVVKAGGGVKI